MTPTVAVFGILRFPPERMSELRPHLRTLVENTYANDGCIAYDVGEDPFDPGLIRFSELWPNHDSLARHLQAPHIDEVQIGVARPQVSSSQWPVELHVCSLLVSGSGLQHPQ